MKFLLQGAQRSLLRGFGRRYLATSTEQYAKRNYANNLSEYNTVFTSLTAKRRHYLLRDAYDDMVLDGVQPSRDTFHSLIAGTMKGSRLQDAFYFRDEMKTMGLLPDVVLYNFLISTCGKSKNSDQAIKILDEMKNSGVKPNGQTYICLLNACAAAGRLDPVYAIVRDMTSAGVGLNKFCYAGLIAAHKNKTPIAEDVATKIIELVEQSKGWSSVEASTGENAENVMMNVSEEELYNLPTADYVHKRRGFLRKELTVYHVAFHAFTELKNVQAMEVLVEMLKSEKKDPDSFILLQIMRCYLLSGDLDRALQVFNDYMNSMKPSFIELYTVLIEGAMVGHTPRGMQIALDKLEEMTQRSFFLFPKIANDLLLIAAGDKKGGYTTANYIWDLTQARKMPLSFPAVEAYYNGLKGRCVPEDDPRWLLVSSTYERLRPRSGAGTGPARQQAQNIKTDTKERMAS
ncbi:LOW QUALITY PROTEIN: pentatricopeptide repeat-containing protein At4g35850, mitochondrial-like [Populus alba]|uniref:LOW QUALITY PROTEIN: pentatricopeptide repeat-containing protein At4g35850, mitochondrial-like n=1 Tax=Populus alba TaxID=43335 RepID=UPI003CC78771